MPNGYKISQKRRYDMTFKELRLASGMSRTEYADYFHVPYKTVQNWELGLRECPVYLMELMHYKLQKEGFILVWRV